MCHVNHFFCTYLAINKLFFVSTFHKTKGFWTEERAKRVHDAYSKVHSSYLELHRSFMLILLCICYVKRRSFRPRTHCWSWGCPWHLTGRWVSSQSSPLWMANTKGIHLKGITTSQLFYVIVHMSIFLISCWLSMWSQHSSRPKKHNIPAHTWMRLTLFNWRFT